MSVFYTSKKLKMFVIFMPFYRCGYCLKRFPDVFAADQFGLEKQKTRILTSLLT